MDNKVILETRNLCFSYDSEKKALEDVNIKIKSGESIAVLGANGAGKSTFFLHLNGVRQPSSGEILLDGEVVSGRRKNRELQKNVGIVFQDTDSQIVASTVKAEVAFGPMNMGISKDKVLSYTMDAIREMHIEEYIDRPPHYLSGGEKKRVGIADILAMKPRIIVFDEPTAALDPLNAKMLEQTLHQLQQQNKTILLSTHDVDFAYRFAERVVVFHQGHIVADAKPEEVFSNHELLRSTNLKKPMIMEMFDLLREQGLVEGKKYPKNLEELKGSLVSKKGEE